MSEAEIRRQTWERLQAFEQQAYREDYRRNGDYRGYFSIDAYGDSKAAGERITQSCRTCLDVGSGVLPRPAYMRPPTRWYGLDPFPGEGRREFGFARAIGESLPFPSAAFECVAFMSTLDHQIEPRVSLLEAWRVLRDRGLLFLWLNLCEGLMYYDYAAWRERGPGALFNAHHQYAFVEGDVRALLEQSGFRWQQRIDYPGTHYWSRSQLIIAEKP